MKKEFVSFNQVRNESLKLAHRIHSEGFIPDVIYVSLRGGVYVGNIISEYFKIVRSKSKKMVRPVFYAAVVARSYSDVKTREKVKVDGWTYSPEYLRSGDKVLLVDDIFDSGKTVNYLVSILLEKGIPREDIRVAVHDFKERKGETEHLPVLPDYYCRKHHISRDNEDVWIHYMSHELVGLSQEEIETHYGDDEEIKNILKDTLG
jgi:uncharacterized protein